MWRLVTPPRSIVRPAVAVEERKKGRTIAIKVETFKLSTFNLVRPAVAEEERKGRFIETRLFRPHVYANGFQSAVH